MTNHWQTPLGLAQRHDKARERANRLRKQADDLDAQADEFSQQYEKAIAEIRSRMEAAIPRAAAQ